MGQYYKPVMLNENREPLASIYSHDYDNGLKLMEHSYIGNKFVEAFEFQLTPEGNYHKSRVMWVGDYSEGNMYEQAELVLTNFETVPVETMVDYPFIVNHSKKQYVDKTKVSEIDGWAVHPLPLLTSDGNGNGGGDYFTDDINELALIGSWCGDIISVEKEIVSEMEGYREIEIPFKCDW